MPTDRIEADPDLYRLKYQQEINLCLERPCNFVVSFPKSGRTWHRAMVRTYLSLNLGVDQSAVFDLLKLTRTAGENEIHYSHNGANFIDNIGPTEPLLGSNRLWSGRKVIFLIRDLRDILVSAWHHARYRDAVTTMDLSSFVRCPETGVEKILTAYNRWHANLGCAKEHLVLAYEDMHRDPGASLKATLLFFEFKEVCEDTVSQAALQCGFDRMRDREIEGFYSADIARTKTNDERARKMRRGEVGAYVDYLSKDDLSFIDDAEFRIKNPLIECARILAT